MSATAFTLPGLLPSSPTALVVEPVLGHLLATLTALSPLGFDVSVAETFADAKTSLGRGRPPVLLVTDIRLREYNGLHLVLRARSLFPQVAAVVTSEVDDPVLQREAEAMHATYVVMPASREDLTAAVVRTLLRIPDAEGKLAPVRPPFERRHGERRTRAISLDGNERRVSERRRDAVSTLRAMGR